jgi:predicted signal transduction protein with EAL and GGDEF domain
MMISVGAAVFPHDGDSYESLLAKADSRMYRDKSQRKAARARLRSTEAMESAGYTGGGGLPHPAARAR